MEDYEDKPTRLKNTKHLRKIQRKRDSTEEFTKISEGKRPVVPAPQVKDWLKDFPDDDYYWPIDYWDEDDNL